MGKGRVGGARAKIRGKVGNSVYQIVREPDGSYSQMVYAQSEDRNDTLTPDLVRQRIMMSMCYKWMAAIPFILNSAFGKGRYKPLNLQEFVRLNIPRLRQNIDDDSDILPVDWFYEYGDPYFYPEPMQITDGNRLANVFGGFSVDLFSSRWVVNWQMDSFRVGLTVAGWMAQRRMSVGDLFVLVCTFADIEPERNFLALIRFTLKPSVPLETVITPSNFWSLFEVDSDLNIEVECPLQPSGTSYRPRVRLYSEDCGNVMFFGGAAEIDSNYVDGEWRLSRSYVVTTKGEKFGFSLRRTLSDVWDSWYTDRLDS